MIYLDFFKASLVAWGFPFFHIIKSIWCFSFGKPNQCISLFRFFHWYLIYLLFALCFSFCLLWEKVWYHFYQLKSKDERHILTRNKWITLMKYLLLNQMNLLIDNDYCQTKFYNTLKLRKSQLKIYFLHSFRNIHFIHLISLYSSS